MTTASKIQTTGIGSLPHHNIDAALAFSFQPSIPFLPQIPIRNPWEFMIAQALDGLPGLQVAPDGSVQLDVNVWSGRARSLDERLLLAFDRAGEFYAFESFEPSSATSSSWQPFVWELEERRVKTAKIQLAGPLTAQWAIRLREHGQAAGTNTISIDQYPEITTQIYRLVLARALGMSRRLQSLDVQPILFLDEPGLLAFSLRNPRHVLALQELKLMVQTLRKNDVQVGLHCCSDSDWGMLLALDLNYLSLDVNLSLPGLLTHRKLLEQFLDRGGKLSLGIIPSPEIAGALAAMSAKELVRSLRATLEMALPDQPKLQQKIMQTSIYTPACGLAFHTIEDAETVLALLDKIPTLLQS